MISVLYIRLTQTKREKGKGNNASQKLSRTYGIFPLLIIIVTHTQSLSAMSHILLVDVCSIVPPSSLACMSSTSDREQRGRRSRSSSSCCVSSEGGDATLLRKIVPLSSPLLSPSMFFSNQLVLSLHFRDWQEIISHVAFLPTS